jgi:hypothetical protein
MRIKHLIVIALIIIVLYATRTMFEEGFVDQGRCGVDLPSCNDGLRCINGYCKSDVPPELPVMSDLPIMPTTK